MKILAIPGSLRPNSSSHALLKVLISLAPPDVSITVYDGLAQLPHFDDRNPAPALVVNFQAQLKAADGVLICTPEYAFGVPGSLKNALDWTVSSGDFMDKPVALITASSGGEYGHASLLLTLKAISSKIVEGGTLLIPFIRSKIDREGNISDPVVTRSLEDVLNALIETIRNEKTSVQ